MRNSVRPLVSVGMPVFNASKSLPLAAETILGQSYRNIELVISDNGSTDDTLQIALKLAHSDSRVRVLASESNLGIFHNFNKVLQASVGDFFMWAACDDLHDSKFIEKCVELLIENPSAVLCQSKVAVCLESEDRVIYYATLDSIIDKSRVVGRYRETLRNIQAVGIYGVYRSNAIKSIPGISEIPGGDLFWIKRLSLVGEFIQSREVLFRYIARSKWNSFSDDLKNLNFGDGFNKWWIYRHTIVFLELTKAIKSTNFSLSTKMRLLAITFEFSFKNLVVRGILKLMQLMGTNQKAFLVKTRWYWLFMHNPNTQIVNMQDFQRRVVNPTIGIS